jgi:hypothetical protein
VVLDDEEVIIHPTCLAREVIVFQPNTGICLAVIFGNIIQLLAALWETCVTYVTPKSLGSKPHRTEAAPFSVVPSTMTRVMLTVLGAHALNPLAGLTVCQELRAHAWMAWQKTGRNLGRRGCGPIHGELCGSPLSAGLRAVGSRPQPTAKVSSPPAARWRC